MCRAMKKHRLSELEPGLRATVVKFEFENLEELSRLRQLGLTRGSSVEVLSSNLKGPVLLKIGDTRIAVHKSRSSSINLSEG